MRSLTDRFWRLFEDRLDLDHVSDPIGTVRLRTLLAFSLIVGCLLLAFYLVRKFSYGVVFSLNPALFISAIVLSIPFLIYRLKNLHIPALIFVSSSVVVILTSAFGNGGLDVPSLSYLIVVSTFAAIMWGFKGGLAGIALCLGCLVTLKLAQDMGRLPPPNETAETRTEVAALVLFLVAAQITFMIANFQQVLFRMAQRVKDRRDHLKLTIETVHEGMLVFDSEKRLKTWNARACELLPLDEKEMSRRPTVKAVLRRALESAENETRSVDDLFSERMQDLDHLLEAADSDIRHFGRRQINGRILEISTRSMLDGGLLATFDDVTESVKQQEAIEKLAVTDALTGLANRHQFQTRLRDLIEMTARHKRRGALCLLDLDNFKPINDTYGHQAGDHVLKVIADRLRSSLRSTDCIARLGGDEFAVIVTNLAEHENINTPCKKLIQTINEPIPYEGKELHVGTSIGVSYFPDDGNEGMELVRKADLALYCAKEQGRNIMRLFQSELDERVRRRATLEMEMSKAIANNELEFRFQPQVHLETDEVTGVEALLRWNHPVRGLLSPGAFLDVVEAGEICSQLSQWVLGSAVAQISEWRAKQVPFGRVTINLSAAEFQRGDLIKFLKDALARTDVPPTTIELDIAESALPPNCEKVIETLNALKELGIAVAIDDFGMGYSSLERLKRLPVERLKIDGSFVKAMLDDPASNAIVAAITKLGHSLSFEVIAENVESPEQIAVLRRLECDIVQGYRIARPMAADELEQWLCNRALQKTSVSDRTNNQFVIRHKP